MIYPVVELVLNNIPYDLSGALLSFERHARGVTFKFKAEGLPLEIHPLDQEWIGGLLWLREEGERRKSKIVEQPTLSEHIVTVQGLQGTQTVLLGNRLEDATLLLQATQEDVLLLNLIKKNDRLLLEEVERYQEVIFGSLPCVLKPLFRSPYGTLSEAVGKGELVIFLENLSQLFPTTGYLLIGEEEYTIQERRIFQEERPFISITLASKTLKSYKAGEAVFLSRQPSWWIAPTGTTALEIGEQRLEKQNAQESIPISGDVFLPCGVVRLWGKERALEDCGSLQTLLEFDDASQSTSLNPSHAIGAVHRTITQAIGDATVEMSEDAALTFPALPESSLEVRYAFSYEVGNIPSLGVTTIWVGDHVIYNQLNDSVLYNPQKVQFTDSHFKGILMPVKFKTTGLITGDTPFVTFRNVHRFVKEGHNNDNLFSSIGKGQALKATLKSPVDKLGRLEKAEAVVQYFFNKRLSTSERILIQGYNGQKRYTLLTAQTAGGLAGEDRTQELAFPFNTGHAFLSNQNISALISGGIATLTNLMGKQKETFFIPPYQVEKNNGSYTRFSNMEFLPPVNLNTSETHKLWIYFQPVPVKDLLYMNANGIRLVSHGKFKSDATLRNLLNYSTHTHQRTRSWDSTRKESILDVSSGNVNRNGGLRGPFVFNHKNAALPLRFACPPEKDPFQTTKTPGTSIYMIQPLYPQPNPAYIIIEWSIIPPSFSSTKASGKLQILKPNLPLKGESKTEIDLSTHSQPTRTTTKYLPLDWIQELSQLNSLLLEVSLQSTTTPSNIRLNVVRCLLRITYQEQCYKPVHSHWLLCHSSGRLDEILTTLSHRLGLSFRKEHSVVSIGFDTVLKGLLPGNQNCWKVLSELCEMLDGGWSAEDGLRLYDRRDGQVVKSFTPGDYKSFSVHFSDSNERCHNVLITFGKETEKQYTYVYPSPSEILKRHSARDLSFSIATLDKNPTPANTKSFKFPWQVEKQTGENIAKRLYQRYATLRRTITLLLPTPSPLKTGDKVLISLPSMKGEFLKAVITSTNNQGLQCEEIPHHTTPFTGTALK